MQVQQMYVDKLKYEDLYTLITSYGFAYSKPASIAGGGARGEVNDLWRDKIACYVSLLGCCSWFVQRLHGSLGVGVYGCGVAWR